MNNVLFIFYVWVLIIIMQACKLVPVIMDICLANLSFWLGIMLGLTGQFADRPLISYDLKYRNIIIIFI